MGLIRDPGSSSDVHLGSFCYFYSDSEKIRPLRVVQVQGATALSFF